VTDGAIDRLIGEILDAEERRVGELLQLVGGATAAIA
jgi:hypothetical protein